MDAEWFWYRFEYQARGSIHAHGCAKFKNNPDIRLLCKRACLAVLENENKHEMSPNDFELFCQDMINEGEKAENLLIKLKFIYYLGSYIYIFIPLFEMFLFNILHKSKYCFRFQMAT